MDRYKHQSPAGWKDLIKAFIFTTILVLVASLVYGVPQDGIHAWSGTVSGDRMRYFSYLHTARHYGAVEALNLYGIKPNNQLSEQRKEVSEMPAQTDNSIQTLIEKYAITESAILARVEESRKTMNGTDKQLHDAAVRFLSTKTEEIAKYSGKVTWK